LVGAISKTPNIKGSIDCSMFLNLAKKPDILFYSQLSHFKAEKVKKIQKTEKNTEK
jgi:hypothetical protein